MTCKRGHALTPENTYVHPRSGAICRSCQREQGKLRKQAAYARDFKAIEPYRHPVTERGAGR